MKDGLGRAMEVERDLPLKLAQQAVEDPHVLLAADIDIVQALRRWTTTIPQSHPTPPAHSRWRAARRLCMHHFCVLNSSSKKSLR